VLQVDALSTVYVKTQIIAYSNGILVDPTSDNVEMAFSLLPPNPSGQPVSLYPDPATWYTASWETVNIGEVTSYYARTLIGPDGTVDLSVGVSLPSVFYCRVKIFDNPETPVLRCGPFALV
jgi:hypothetical protein